MESDACMPLYVSTHELAEVRMRSAAAAAADGGRASNSLLLEDATLLDLHGAFTELRMLLKACICGCTLGKLSDAVSMVERPQQSSALPKQCQLTCKSHKKLQRAGSTGFVVGERSCCASSAAVFRQLSKFLKTMSYFSASTSDTRWTCTRLMQECVACVLGTRPNMSRSVTTTRPGSPD
jgi:hypothetical protein